MLTICPEYLYVKKLFRAGTFGFVYKSSAVTDLIAAIYSVYENGRYLSPALALELAYDTLTSDNIIKQQLTYNELKFAIMLNEGHDVKHIACDLGIEHMNALGMKRRILKKLKIKSFLDLVHYFDT